MAYQTSTFNGDEVYSIRCTGDACAGDYVAFERAMFVGSFRNAKFTGFERIEGEIIRDSYGRDKQQHTFTLRLADGSVTRVKGRVMYREGTYRRPWADESLRRAALDEKHGRGDSARAIRAKRREFWA